MARGPWGTRKGRPRAEGNRKAGVRALGLKQDRPRGKGYRKTRARAE